MTTSHNPHPLRIQRLRSKGWRKPDGVVNVARPSKYGNPFPVAIYGHAGCLLLFRRYLDDLVAQQPDFLSPLKGKRLMCWCRLDLPCHADILAELANSQEGT